MIDSTDDGTLWMTAGEETSYHLERINGKTLIWSQYIQLQQNLYKYMMKYSVGALTLVST